MYKKQEHCIMLNFNGGLDLEQCFMALFCTVPVYRLNGCAFYAKEGENGNILMLGGKNKSRLEEMAAVINSAPDMFEKLREKNVKVALKQNDKFAEIGFVSASKIKGPSTKAARKGLEMADLNERYASAVKFKPQQCPKCGKDVFWQAYCPNRKCRKQYMKLSKNGKIYVGLALVFYFLLIISMFTSQSLGILDALLLKTEADVVFQTSLCAFGIIGLIYIIKYRMKGFWLYIMLRVFELITGLFAFFANMSAYNLVYTLICGVWFALAFIMLERDLDYMF